MNQKGSRVASLLILNGQLLALQRVDDGQKTLPSLPISFAHHSPIKQALSVQQKCSVGHAHLYLS
ncbi:hypothetical protein CGT84_01070 [Vibrio cholerae]|nr:hypothetical protein XV88_04130 [Vibrio cholerae]PAR90015.1 hypothetical protein CGT84_01070 [Vibrio cholerae]